MHRHNPSVPHPHLGRVATARGSAEVTVDLVRVPTAERVLLLCYPLGDADRAGRRAVGVGQPIGHGAVLITGEQRVPQGPPHYLPPPPHHGPPPPHPAPPPTH